MIPNRRTDVTSRSGGFRPRSAATRRRRVRTGKATHRLAPQAAAARLSMRVTLWLAERTGHECTARNAATAWRRAGPAGRPCHHGLRGPRHIRQTRDPLLLRAGLRSLQPDERSSPTTSRRTSRTCDPICRLWNARWQEPATAACASLRIATASRPARHSCVQQGHRRRGQITRVGSARRDGRMRNRLLVLVAAPMMAGLGITGRQRARNGKRLEEWT